MPRYSSRARLPSMKLMADFAAGTSARPGWYSGSLMFAVRVGRSTFSHNVRIWLESRRGQLATVFDRWIDHQKREPALSVQPAGGKGTILQILGITPCNLAEQSRYRLLELLAQ